MTYSGSKSNITDCVVRYFNKNMEWKLDPHVLKRVLK